MQNVILSRMAGCVGRVESGVERKSSAAGSDIKYIKYKLVF